MAGYNRIIIVGNLTRDPDYKQLPSGQALCRLGLATNRQFRNKQTGTMVQEVCYIDVDVWGPQAESCRQYLQKGRGVLIEGRLKFDSWEDGQGQTRSKHSIVADRVVFIGSAAAEDVEDELAAISPKTQAATVTSAEPFSPEVPPEMEKNILNQIKNIKSRTSKPAASAAGTVPSMGEIDFTDSPPFKDDLPF